MKIPQVCSHLLPIAALAVVMCLCGATSALAAEGASTEPSATDQLAYAIDNLVLLGAAVLVLFMQAGFAMLEAGLNSAKNTVNILAKNLLDLCVGVLLFFLVGFGLMYPGESNWLGIVGFGGTGLERHTDVIAAGQLNPQVDFLFQVAFAATAATIVSGAVAGRMRFGAYLVYSAVLTALIYPIGGMWHWGGGWLAQMGFQDFAGSIVVHAVGGFAGLAGAIVLGPRIGRFVRGKSHPIPGHNLTFAALGVFVLWVGWYGFNPGSQLAFTGASNTDATVMIAVNTTLAAAAGAVAAIGLSWILFKKPDLTMGLNGALAGLVGITANCNQVVNVSALIIGAVAGLLVVGGVMLLDRLRIDDPVGAFPVHGLCGVWGGVATGIFSTEATCSIGVQLLGTSVICAWAFVTMLGVFWTLKAFGVLRVTAEEELGGLDLCEHGMHAYPPNMLSDSWGGVPPSASAPPAGQPFPSPVASPAVGEAG